MAHQKGANRQIFVSLNRVAPLLDQAREGGVDADALLRDLALPPESALRADHKAVSLADYYRIQNRLAILFGDETCHMSARQLLPGSTDFVLQHAGDCRSLYEVMKVIARSYNLLHGGDYNFVEKKDASIDYIIDDRNFPYTVSPSTDYIYFSMECILIFLHCMLMTASPSSEPTVKSLQIRRPKAAEDLKHLDYWSAAIKFGAPVYRVSFEKDTALRSIQPPPAAVLNSNAVYQKLVEAVAGGKAGNPSRRPAAAMVKDALSRGVVEQQTVAEQMGVSVATLRRRLQDEATSFRDLRREVLNETAKRLLANNRSIADVSEALGFSEFRSFNRAFKEWNGLTPKAYVRQSQH